MLYSIVDLDLYENVTHLRRLKRTSQSQPIYAPTKNAPANQARTSLSFKVARLFPRPDCSGASLLPSPPL